MNLLLEVVGQSSLGVPVEDFFENEELARKALSCHLSMDLLCQEMQDAGRSEDYRKVGNDVLEQLSFNSALFRWLVRRNLSSRHVDCRCCTVFGQFSTGIVAINALLARRHCFKVLLKQPQGDIPRHGQQTL